MSTLLTEEERTAAKRMIAAGQSLRSIGKALNRAPNSIKAIRDDPANFDEIMQEREKLAGKYQNLADRLITGISDEQISKAPLGTRVLASCQAVDKAETLRGFNRNAQAF